MGATPYFHVVDSSGNIVFYGSGDGGNETVPQYHDNRDEIFDFVANLFGDEKYEADVLYESATSQRAIDREHRSQNYSWRPTNLFSVEGL